MAGDDECYLLRPDETNSVGWPEKKETTLIRLCDRAASGGSFELK
jgi:hypothetical protein